MPTLEQNDVQFAVESASPLSVSWRVAPCPYASGTVLARTGRSQEGAARGGARSAPPAREARADARIRTADPFITSEVLYQLSYVGGGS